MSWHSGIEAMTQMTRYKAIFAPATATDRARAFEEYWAYLVARDGAMEEDTRSLEHKTAHYRTIQAHPVRAGRSLTQARTLGEISRRVAQQDLTRADPRLLTLAVMYQFASHESAGIAAAWESTPRWAQCTSVREKITRYHLCEEFCHLRLFAEMFQVFDLRAEWATLSWSKRLMYGAFTHVPGWLLSPIALGSEVMGIVFYRHIRRVLQEVFAAEPQALARLLELLGEIMVDELGHIGERRNYLGNSGVRLARGLLPFLMRGFFGNIPGARRMLDVDRMIREAVVFDYSGIDPTITVRAWIPAYCQA
jgi:hypothetical protein